MLFKIIESNRFNAKKFCKLYCEVGKLPRTIPAIKSPTNSSNSLRSSFIDYFKSNDHVFIEPCSVRNKSGTLFVNSGVSQFKNHILGERTQFENVSKAVNSQRCIRLGGEKCDLENIGYDSIHLSYFEMLGNWSFKAYNKEEACRFMWQYLTEILKLPASHLYITYFGGSEELGLPPDNETRDIWFNLGVKDNKILQFGEKDNLWEMGARTENPLCGPSTEIHWDYLATLNDSAVPRCARCFVNADSPEVIELWNCVFIQYQWAAAGKRLEPLPALFVDTGMGLERLASVVQGVTGVYDTDNFSKIIEHIGMVSGALPYEGTFPFTQNVPISTQMHLENVKNAEKYIDSLRRDVAYRIIADHLRTLCIAVYDGLQPGRQGVELKIRQLLHRTIRQSKHGLGMTGGLSSVIDTVCQTLEGQINSNEPMRNAVKKIIEKEEKKFLLKLENYEKSFESFLRLRESNSQEINATEIHQLIAGDFGYPISLNMIRAISKDLGMQVNVDTVDETLNDIDSNESSTVSLSLPEMLLSKKIPATKCNFIYNYSYNEKSGLYETENIETSILFVLYKSPDNPKSTTDIKPFENVKKFGLVTSETNMYAEKGGQDSDKGVILYNGIVAANVTHVEWQDNIVIHWCDVVDPFISFSPSVKITLHVSPHHRTGTSLHHTAHHLVFLGINTLVGQATQTSSSVRSDYAKLGFSVDLTYGDSSILEKSDFINQLEAFCKNLIEKHIPIDVKENMSLSELTQNNNIRYVRSECLPTNARVISIDGSQEACCGTHAHNTKHLQDIIITSIKKVKQANAEISFVTGQKAVEIRKTEDKLVKMCNDINSRLIWTNEEIDTTIYKLNHLLHSETCSKTARNKINQCIYNVNIKRNIVVGISQILRQELSNFQNAQSDFCIINSAITSMRKVVHVVTDMKISHPILIYSNEKVLLYMPKVHAIDCVPTLLHNVDISSDDYIQETPNIKNSDESSPNEFVLLTFQKHFDYVDDLLINFKDLVKKKYHKA